MKKGRNRNKKGRTEMKKVRNRNEEREEQK